MSKHKIRRMQAAQRERKKMAAITTTPPEGERRVTFMQDSMLKFPELWLAVWIEGDHFEQVQFAELLVRGHCRKAESPEKADLVVFTGGPDVDPLLYMQQAHPTTRVELPRDKKDIELYSLCYQQGIPMLGICRGAQFLNVMNGGSLYQDVDGHYGDHSMWDKRNMRVVHAVSSVHHQMVMDNTENGMEVIATSNGRSQTRYINDTRKETGQGTDIEAFWYRDTCAIGIQGHPEYRGYAQFAKWTLDLLDDLVLGNPDLALIGGVYRIKQDLLEQRQQFGRKD